MRTEHIEARLQSETPHDEERWAARAMPATVDGARADLGASWSVPTVAMASAILAIVVGSAMWWLAGGSGDGGVGIEPSPTSPGSETSNSPAPGTRACDGGDFLVWSDAWGAAAGSRGTIVVLRVVESTPSCVLPSVIGARITDGSGAVLVAATSPSMPAVEVESGAQVEFGISWSNWCGAPPESLSLVADLGNDTVPIGPADSGILVPPCMGEGQPTALNVTGFQPSERPPLR